MENDKIFTEENKNNKIFHSQEKIYNSINIKSIKLPKLHISNIDNISNRSQSNQNDSSRFETAPNYSFFENKFLSSDGSHRKRRNIKIPKFFFNTELKVPELRMFHQNVMENNERSFVNKFLKKEIIEKEKFLEELKNDVKKEKEIESFKSKGHIDLNKIRENYFFKKEYPQRWASEEAKKILKKQIKEVKFRRKINNNDNNTKKNNKRLVIQKLERYKFISYQDPILQINKSGSVPFLINNGEILYKLFQQGNKLNINKSKKKLIK